MKAAKAIAVILATTLSLLFFLIWINGKILGNVMSWEEMSSHQYMATVAIRLMLILIGILGLVAILFLPMYYEDKH